MKARKCLAVTRSATSPSSFRCRPERPRRSGTPMTAFTTPIWTPYPGYYQTADAGYKDEDGYIFVMARTDDIINVAGHRLSTGAMEEVLAAHADVAECAVIGVADQLKGQLPLGFVVLKAGVDRPEEIIGAELVDLVRGRIGPVAAFKMAVVVHACRKPDPARSCAERCAASPTPRNTRSRPRSTTLRSSMKSRPRCRRSATPSRAHTRKCASVPRETVRAQGRDQLSVLPTGR